MAEYKIILLQMDYLKVLKHHPDCYLMRCPGGSANSVELATLQHLGQPTSPHQLLWEQLTGTYLPREFSKTPALIQGLPGACAVTANLHLLTLTCCAMVYCNAEERGGFCVSKSMVRPTLHVSKPCSLFLYHGEGLISYITSILAQVSVQKS